MRGRWEGESEKRRSPVREAEVRVMCFEGGVRSPEPRNPGDL